MDWQDWLFDNELIKFLNNSWLIIWEFVLKEKTYNSRKLSTNETLIFIFDNGLKLIRRILQIIISAISVIRLNPL